MDKLFSNMLQLPLFQGIGQEDFTNILGRVKLHFTKHPAGETFIRRGDPCNELIFLLNGKLAISTASSDESFLFTEYVEDSYLIEPQALFGLQTCYMSSYTAETDLSMLRITKDQIVKDLFKYQIFRINFANFVCNKTQVLRNKLWKAIPTDMEHKIAYFILQRCERIEGEKRLAIQMKNLTHIFHESEQSIFQALNDL